MLRNVPHPFKMQFIFCLLVAKQCKRHLFLWGLPPHRPSVYSSFYRDNAIILLWHSFSSDHLQWGWHFSQGLQCLLVAIRPGGLPGEDDWLSSLKLVSIGWQDLKKRISLPRFHGLRDLVRIFFLYPACLSCLPLLVSHCFPSRCCSLLASRLELFIVFLVSVLWPTIWLQFPFSLCSTAESQC